jgi:predicted RND superfamily exporter protein
MHKAFHPTSYDSLHLVLDKPSIIKYGHYFNRDSKTNYLFNKNQTIYKFNARMRDFGRHEVETINNEIIAHINSLIDSTKIKARIAGMDVLFDHAHQQRINNMFLGLLIAVIVVGFTLGMIFKNFAMTVLALILNIVPIIISAGIMGFTNLELRSGTSIIFTIGFVIAVDNTIHLLSKFQLERKKGLPVELALNHAMQECGKAILATGIILFGGFFVLMFSEFLEIYTLGLLMILVVFIALTADLILAPILILKWFKKYL